MNQEPAKQKKFNALLDKGVDLCIKLDFQKAQKFLAQAIRVDADNELGWLWLSRTFTDLTRIQNSLAKAYKLNPEYPEILQDISKVRSARQTTLEQIVRCPFCFAPIDSKAIQCHYCRSFVIINLSTLPKMGTVGNQRELLKALIRFDSIKKENEMNSNLLFYYGFSCLNMGQYKKAIIYFKHLQSQQSKTHWSNTLQVMIDLAIEYYKSGQNKHNYNGSNRKLILVVEDSLTTRKVITKTLHEGGFNTIEACDGMEALGKMSEKTPDLVLLDIMLPKIDGYGILSIMKENDQYHKIPVIMLTAKKKLTDKIRGRFSSADAYVTKPFHSKELIKQVKKYIS